MATSTEKTDAERRVRDWLADNEVPQPTFVEHGYTCIRLFWEDSKVALVIDIDELPEERVEIRFSEREADQ